jgi:putative transcriptional regulator
LQQKVAEIVDKQLTVAIYYNQTATQCCQEVKYMIRHKLRKLRGTRSQTEVARELGITRQMLSAIESGERNPSLELANKIAVFYGVPIEDIFFDDNGNEVQQPSGGDAA